MKITRQLCPGDRYVYDFGLCIYEKGWAQVDTAQDASYFGTWANPTRLMIFIYCEGDTTLQEAASPDEFAAELREIDAWNRAHGYGPARIDPGFDPAMKAVFKVLGQGADGIDAQRGQPLCEETIKFDLARLRILLLIYWFS